jgi:lipoprotein-anchoring transpeptidase ErfK/SrfK
LRRRIQPDFVAASGARVPALHGLSKIKNNLSKKCRSRRAGTFTSIGDYRANSSAEYLNSSAEYLMSGAELLRRACVAALGAAFATIVVGAALAQPLANPWTANPWIAHPLIDRGGAPLGLTAPQAQQPGATTDGDELPAALRRQLVLFPSNEPGGTIIIDTAHTFLYLTLGYGKALRYGIGVGRKGFTWSGIERISRKSEWPDWIPPAEMIARQPYLPRWVGGGPGNPLGARALYLGNTDYRIHGTNNPASIGTQVSSGCIRLRNADVIDLYDRVTVGTKVIVLANGQHSVALDKPNNDQPGVSIGRAAGGVMAAGIPVAPAPRAARSDGFTSSGLH